MPNFWLEAVLIMLNEKAVWGLRSRTWFGQKLELGSEWVTVVCCKLIWYSYLNSLKSAQNGSHFRNNNSSFILLLKSSICSHLNWTYSSVFGKSPLIQASCQTVSHFLIKLWPRFVTVCYCCWTYIANVSCSTSLVGLTVMLNSHEKSFPHHSLDLRVTTEPLS